ncbi:precorrin-2 dehydrogenase/sirohydrochlorin ferrochelatase family protein [Deinococcus maricopensis]|uniref:precorrin-2 dehydrogenase/sirohydrochlorin ferrochelatase family protein n=1 Tax=Deinococcus maricopensis TaxID=309887 RepID=UPI0002EDAAF0|nr:bifunctional precorrin-2 dehydrogenase/sirohydrochlorin ferrochelatase [Deinococcus maricopensis]
MKLYPAFLDLRGERVLVVGGGPVAHRRARALLDAGAHVSVVAPDVLPDLAGLPVQVERRAFRPADVAGARLVFACTDRDDVNDAVAAAARDAGILVNHAGRAEGGSVRLGATLTRGPVTVAVNTGGELPMLAQALRDHLNAALPEHLPVDDWTAARERALTHPEPERTHALNALRARIHAALQAARPSEAHA